MMRYGRDPEPSAHGSLKLLPYHGSESFQDDPVAGGAHCPHPGWVPGHVESTVPVSSGLSLDARSERGSPESERSVDKLLGDSGGRLLFAEGVKLIGDKLPAPGLSKAGKATLKVCTGVRWPDPHLALPCQLVHPVATASPGLFKVFVGPPVLAARVAEGLDEATEVELLELVPQLKVGAITVDDGEDIRGCSEEE